MAKEDLLTRAEKAFFHAMLSGGIMPLVTAAYEVLQWPVFVGDDASNVIYQVPNESVGFEDYDYLLKTRRVPQELYLAFHKKYFSEMSRSKQTTLVIKDGFSEKRPQILNTIQVNGKNVATVVLHPTSEFPTEEEIEVVKLFCHVLTAEYCKLANNEKFPTKRKLLYLTTILENTAVPASIIDATQRLAQELQGNYAIMISMIAGDSSKTWIPSFFCCNAMRLDNNVVSIMFEGNIVTLCGNIKEPNYSKGYPAIMQKIIDMSGQCAMATGVTTVFSDLKDIKSYYQQALLTARVGCRLEPEKTVYDFYDFAPLQVFVPAVLNYELNTFLHPCVQEMMEWDAKYQTQYLKTLKAYLFLGRNNKVTAQTLYIHQNTLLYRITKIKDLFNVDFSDTKMTLSLLCNLLLLEIAKPEVFE